jgi:hypothetical protein
MATIVPIKPCKRPRKPTHTLKRMPARAKPRLNAACARVLCQGRVSEPLYVAVRQHLLRHNLQVQDMLSWALEEYLRLHDPKAFDKLRA